MYASHLHLLNRGDLWVVGAQNAGKSSLISAMKKLGGTSGKSEDAS
jgi:ribosome biogenesis GTPase A